MATYIIPIFCFGLVITGIVFIGVQQAADLAKKLAAQSNEIDPVPNDPHAASLGRNSAPVKPLASVLRP